MVIDIRQKQADFWGFNTVQHFDGKTYDPALDHERLSKQLGRVYETLMDGRWWTLYGIQSTIRKRDGKHDSEAGISARIRDLRKVKFGGYVVEHRRNDTGLWQYRLVIDEPT